jgi:hypothetical protein
MTFSGHKKSTLPISIARCSAVAATLTHQARVVALNKNNKESNSHKSQQQTLPQRSRIRL